MGKPRDNSQKHYCDQPTALRKARALRVEQNLVLTLAGGPKLQLFCEKSWLLESATIPPLLAADWRQRPAEEQLAALIQKRLSVATGPGEPRLPPRARRRWRCTVPICSRWPRLSSPAQPLRSSASIGARRWRRTSWAPRRHRRLATEYKAASLCSTPGSHGSRPIASMSIKVIATAITQSNSVSRSRTDRRSRRRPRQCFPLRCRVPLSGLPLRWLARIGLTYGALRV
jgi:hypothetical protein